MMAEMLIKAHFFNVYLTFALWCREIFNFFKEYYILKKLNTNLLTNQKFKLWKN